MMYIPFGTLLFTLILCILDIVGDNMVIDTTDVKQMAEYERAKERLIEEKLDKREYTSSDIALVRVTDHLPVNGLVPAISNVPFVKVMHDVAYTAVYNMFKEPGKSWDEISSKAETVSPLSTQYRSSVHFCLNGIVSSHMQGNFEGNPFVIIEPFREHENDDNILAVRGEDTYFKEGLQLSDSAVILVDERYAQQCLDSSVDPKRVIFYRGVQEEAVNMVLVKMGIVPELIGKDYIIDSKTSEMIRKFIDDKNYPQDKHCFSESYFKDDEKTLVLWQKYAEKFYSYLYSNVYGDITDKKGEIDYLANAPGFDDEAVEKVGSIIKSIGIDNYRNIVNSYNNAIIEKIERGEYPNNNEILSGAPLENSIPKSV